MEKSRVKALQKGLSEKKLDAMVVSAYPSYRYYSRFSGSNCILIITQDRKILLTDGRYTEQARLQADDFEIVVRPRNVREVMLEVLREIGAVKVGYETMHVSDFEMTQWRVMAKDIHWAPQMEFGVHERERKDEREIACIKKAVDIADRALSEIIPQIHVGISEREVAALLEYHMMKNGSEHPAFDTIVVSGTRGALPHGTPSDKKLAYGDMVTIDFGACFCGYMSDITRTLWMGDPPKKQTAVWDAVFEAQQACVQAVSPGISVRELDALQRQVFEKHSLSEYIAHSLGHGVGLEIHEAPTLSSSGTATLAPGMIVTIEPGLYLPDICGVRIEDTVLVTETGVRVLTQSPHKIKIDCNSDHFSVL